MSRMIPAQRKAAEILRRLPRIGEKKDGFIFSTTVHTPVSGFSRAKEQIDAAILERCRRRTNLP